MNTSEWRILELGMFALILSKVNDGWAAGMWGVLSLIFCLSFLCMSIQSMRIANRHHHQRHPGRGEVRRLRNQDGER